MKLVWINLLHVSILNAPILKHKTPILAHFDVTIKAKITVSETVISIILYHQPLLQLRLDGDSLTT